MEMKNFNYLCLYPIDLLYKKKDFMNKILTTKRFKNIQGKNVTIQPDIRLKYYILVERLLHIRILQILTFKC